MTSEKRTSFPHGIRLIASTSAATVEIGLCLKGEFWTLTVGDDLFHLRDCKGLRYLSLLLARPDEAISAAALTAESDSEGEPASPPEISSPEGVERARSAVTKRLKDTIAKIERHHADLGRHLRDTVHTGAMCVYRSSPSLALRWRVG